MTLVAIELPGRRVTLRQDNENYYIVELTDDLVCTIRAEYAVGDCARYVVGGDYELHARNDYQIFQDLIVFTRAYVDRPEEFERNPTDTEQENADWWRTFGEHVEIALVEE